MTNTTNTAPDVSAPGFVEIKEKVMAVCGASSMGVAKKQEVRDLLEDLHNLYTGCQEGLVKAQGRLISLLEDHSALKDDLSKAKAAATPPPSDYGNSLLTRPSPRDTCKDGALIWLTGGDISPSDKSTERRIQIVTKVGKKAETVVTDSFFAKDDRLGIRVSDGDRVRASEAAKDLGYQAKVLGSVDPELFIREVGEITEQELRNSIGDSCTSVYKKGLNAFVRVRRDSVEGILTAGVKVGWRLLKPELRHRKVMCYNCCAIGREAHLARACSRDPVCYKCGVKGHDGRSCPGGPPRCANCQGPHNATDHRVCPTVRGLVMRDLGPLAKLY
ncbi:hypothetical protein FOL47_002674 [Perkinsus chesapeaki]|uniref:CCHC-type domain-containing protein n=1 Tax=Perkinsus chesapeaki TaxID=330153 RepID=A0A7J6KQX4_PERCH|nr:hypothetical protein FOL47_002674 [Perkinsus chesapeaki]